MKILVFSPRRAGKTSIILRCIEMLEDKIEKTGHEDQATEAIKHFCSGCSLKNIACEGCPLHSWRDE